MGLVKLKEHVDKTKNFGTYQLPYDNHSQQLLENCLPTGLTPAPKFVHSHKVVIQIFDIFLATPIYFTKNSAVIHNVFMHC